MVSLKLVLRSIFKEGPDFVLVVVGLAVGFVGFLILQMFISAELSYDTFHSDSNKIFRVVTTTKSTDGKEQRIALSDGRLKNYLSETFPAIHTATQFIPIYYGVKVMSNGQSLVEEEGLYVDQDFNSVFDFPIISGNPMTMFSEVNTIALTKSLAIKYFGRVDIVGEELSVDDGFGTEQLRVSGVYDDIPEYSSIKFNFLISGNSYAFWDKFLDRFNENRFFTFLKFNAKIPKDSRGHIESQLDIRHSAFNGNNGHLREYVLQNIKEIHLDTKTEYDLSNKIEPRQIYVLWFISLSIIAITAINFINTNTIQSAAKTKLLGMVKVFGHKNPFTSILVIDSLIKILLALSIATIAIIISNKLVFEWAFHYKLHLPSTYLLLVWATVCIIIGLIGGVVPANYLRRKKVSDIVKGKVLVSQGKYSNLRLTSLTIQLSIAIVLMIMTGVILRQLDYFDSKEVGYEKTNRMLIPAPQGVDSFSYLEFINSANTIHYVKNVGIALSPFYAEYRPITIKTGLSEEIEIKALYNMINSQYIPAMGITMKKGSNFSGIYSSDTTGVIINESAAKLLGSKDIINSTINADVLLYENREFRIIGVMKDFHFKSFSNQIEPLFYFCIPFEDFAGDITISYHSAGAQNLKSDLSTIWQKSGIETPIEFEALEDAYSKTYEDQHLLSRVSKSFTALALFLALFGLFAYLRYNIKLKTKELAIRRVLGATTFQVYYNLQRETVILFLVSVVLATPLSFYMSREWLSQFAYHTTINFNNFILPIGFVFTVVIFVGIYQLFTILSQKTMDVLRHE